MRYFEQNCPLESNSIPPQYNYMWSEIIQNYYRLCDRYSSVITKRKEIWKLAQPKHTKSKYRQKKKCPRPVTCKVEIINKCDKTESTRTEQLAYPQLRYILGARIESVYCILLDVAHAKAQNNNFLHHHLKGNLITAFSFLDSSANLKAIPHSVSSMIFEKVELIV